MNGAFAFITVIYALSLALGAFLMEFGVEGLAHQAGAPNTMCIQAAIWGLGFLCALCVMFASVH